MPVVEHGSMEQVFLADILARPLDDTPRLVYADWLTERDGPGDALRAEFIRVQCQMAQVESRLPEYYWRAAGTAFYDQRSRLLARERELYRVEAQGPLLDHVTWCGWRRGFVECILCQALDWCLHGKELCDQAPIQEVTLLDSLSVVYFPRPSQGWVCLRHAAAPLLTFAVLPFSFWRTAPHHGGEPGLTRWWVPYVWPGITFHGPDFD